ncbi:MAG: hypothetical protein Q4D42_11640 [Eubacteriales bacterium]|nr:hypothetical protein [Eubacteriales bacterium]
MSKKGYTIEEKIRAVELHIRDEMGYVGISDKYGVPIRTLCDSMRKYETFFEGDTISEMIRFALTVFVFAFPFSSGTGEISFLGCVCARSGRFIPCFAIKSSQEQYVLLRHFY